MIAYIPSEIIARISLYLTFSEKMELALTCQKIYISISQQTLYETLYIRGTSYEKEEALNYFKNNQSNNHQVRILVMDFDDLSSSLCCQVPSIFPNITELRANDGDKNVRSLSVVTQVNNWSRTITKIDMEKGFVQTISLLEEYRFSRLSNLSISPYIDLSARRSNYPDISVADCLKNAPCLKQLTIFKCRVDIDFLEIVHTYCLELEILKFDFVLFFIGNYSIPRLITPAKKLLQLELTSSTVISDVNCVLIQYITEKYINLKHLVFFTSLRSSITGLNENDSNRDPIDEFIFEFEIGQLPRIYINTLTKIQGVNYHDTYIAYQNGASKSFSNISLNLKTLKVDSSFFGNILESINQENRKLKKIDLYNTEAIIKDHIENYDPEDQLEYLANQKSLVQLSLVVKSSCQAYKAIISNSITTLNIVIKEGDNGRAIALDWILSCFPSLTILKIDFSEPVVIGNNDNITYPNLKKLYISYSEYDFNLPQYISRIAPNIEEIGWMLDDNLEVEELDLSGSTLKYLQIYCNSLFPKTVYLDITNKSKSKRYLVEEGIRELQEDEEVKYGVWMQKLTVISDSLKIFKYKDKATINL